MPDPLLRVVIQAVVEGLLKTVVHRQLGPHLGDYLRAATDGMELEMEVGVRGVPIRTFDAPLADWASGKLNSAMKDAKEAERAAAESTAAAEAARLLGLSGEQMRMLLDAQAKLPTNPEPSESPAAFSSIGHMLRYFRDIGLGDDAAVRDALGELWYEMVCSLPAARRSTPPDVPRLFTRLHTLTRKPATFTLRFRRLRFGVALKRALGAGCDAAAASLASSGAEHSSARSLLERFREDASKSLTGLTANLKTASLSLVGSLRGGRGGRLRCLSRRLFFEGGLALSRLISPPNVKPYALTTRLLKDGRLQMLLAIPAPPAATDKPGAPDAPDASLVPADAVAVAAPERLLSIHVAQLTASLMIGELEAMRIHLVQTADSTAQADPPPPAPLPPLVPPVSVPQGGHADGGASEATVSGSKPSAILAPTAHPPSLAASATGGRSFSPTRSFDPAAVAVPGSTDVQPAVDAAAAGRPSRRLVEVFENQRRLTAFHKYSAADLLPIGDPGCFSDEHCKEKYVEIDLVPLPLPPNPPPITNHASDGGGGGGVWRWTDQWRVDREGGGKADDGWQYALNWNTGWLSGSNAITLVRRRRWVRHADLVLPTSPMARGQTIPAPLAPPSALPAAVLGDAGSGDLGKNLAQRLASLPDQVAARGKQALHAAAEAAISAGKAGDGYLYSAGVVVGWQRGSSGEVVDPDEPITSLLLATPKGAPKPSSPIVASTAEPAEGRAHALLVERAGAIEEALHAERAPTSGVEPPHAVSAPNVVSDEDSANGSPVASPTPSPAHPKQRQATDPNGNPWSPLCSSGGALLQLSTAPGSHVRLRGQQLDLSSQPALLFDHLTSLLQEQLARHPWYAEPLRVASERARVHLASSRLRVTSALKVIAVVEEEECYVTIEGVPETAEVSTEGHAAAADGAEAADDEEEMMPMEKLHHDVAVRPPTGVYCATFTNEVKIMDLVADVQDIYRSFTENLNSGELFMSD